MGRRALGRGELALENAGSETATGIDFWSRWTDHRVCLLGSNDSAKNAQ